MVVALEDVTVASRRTGVVVVNVIDEHDLSTSAEFSAFLHALVRQNELVIADFSEALFVDSSILGVLIEAHKLAFERGSRLCLQLGDDCAVKRTFEISGLLEQLDWAASRDEALNGSKPTSSHDSSGGSDGRRPGGLLSRGDWCGSSGGHGH